MEKINVAELLKDCPKGMELDCTIFEDVHFDCIDDVSDIINCYIQDSKHKIGISFSKYGCYSNISKSKCVIFPKGKTTWEGFHRPYINGDIVYTIMGSIAILGNRIGEHSEGFHSYCGLFNYEFDTDVIVSPECLAAEEEKQKLFKAIKENGYKWNEETKTLEKLVEPKFKVGDSIQSVRVNLGNIYNVIEVKESSYVVNKNNENSNFHIDFDIQDDWELVPNKFDINTLVPFESRVLVRDNIDEEWHPAIWGYYDANTSYPYKTIGCLSRCCIPYEGNQHLLGTTNDCDEYFKTWK